MPAQRATLLAGRAGPEMADPGPTVCVCFGVGRRAILDCAAEHGNRLGIISKKLKAGTNCGSCVPEIQMLLAGEPFPFEP